MHFLTSWASYDKPTEAEKLKLASDFGSGKFIVPFGDSILSGHQNLGSFKLIIKIVD